MKLREREQNAELMIPTVLGVAEAEWDTLSCKERVERCLQYAEEAERFSPAIASMWRKIAATIEAEVEASP